MKRIQYSAIFAAALLSTSVAHANISTFSGLTSSLTNLASYTEDGIVATPESGKFWGWPTAGQLHLDPSDYAGNTVDFSFTQGLFSLSSIDVSYTSPGAIGTLTAFDLSNNFLFSSVIGQNLGTVNFTGWNNIGRLRLVDTGSHLSVDNLVLAPVPEPETYALMGLGLVGLMAARRRKAKSA